MPPAVNLAHVIAHKHNPRRSEQECEAHGLEPGIPAVGDGTVSPEFLTRSARHQMKTVFRSRGQLVI
jgi:hypothetical protein